ncbi:hypothetical protein GCM10011502_29040 [Oceanisphaera marina]|uniref:Prepilin-type N-terminal cleavage/methylation domain-containing protein n=1 Tax=Oceanisphaera marina TaxID=2017550 RepID=A0ABQ1IW72_9GAMM|nr:prepilin-type cleavage/methylation-like protein [Oceanisphaera marina]GGB54081.1 hypothetical protein GCM10011502_29040 [Oceanisphaera marina]
MALNTPSLPNLSGLTFKQAGISLLEFVLGLALLAIVMLGVTLFYLSQSRQLDPVFQFRAVSLAEALAEQVLAVKYDVNNNPAAQERCNAGACSNSPSTQAIANPKLTNFIAVDDFQLWCNNSENGAKGDIDGEKLAAELNLPQIQLYRRFTIETCVALNDDDPANIFKQVDIKISIDQGDTLSFILHRYNIR